LPACSVAFRIVIDAPARLSYGFRTMRLIGPPAFRNLGRGVF